VAVPALIDAIGDKRLMRMLSPRKMSTHASEFESVVTVGECAQNILRRMSGRSMDREEAIAWWKDFQANGEKATLIEGVRAGNRDSRIQAIQLAKIDPKACLDAAVAGIRAAESDWVAAYLISVIGDQNLDEATAVLRDEMKSHKDLHCRVAAAAGLFRHGGKDSVPWVIDEWRTQAPSFVLEDFKPSGKAQSLIGFLATCGDLSAMRAIAEQFPKLDAMEKVLMMYSVLDKARFDSSSYAGAELPADVENCVEDIGITAFADKTVIDGMSIGGFAGPRVCDLAAIRLSRRWPDRYTFDLKATESERDVQIVRMTNIWRASRGLEPLPLPKLP